MKRIVTILVILSLVSHLVAATAELFHQFSYGPFQDEVFTTNVYFMADTFFKFFLAVAFYAAVKEPFVLKQAVLVIAGLVMNDVIDELFFDPTKFQLNELLFLTLIAIGFTHSLWKRKKISSQRY